MRALPFSGGLVLSALLLLLLPARALAERCAATGASELSPAQVHAARMEAKAASGAFELSSGAMAAARECADLVNRLHSLRLGPAGLPTASELVDALEAAAAAAMKEAVEEACHYAASTGTSWVRSTAGRARSEADEWASRLVGARVSVARPSAASVLRQYWSRMRGSLPSYSDLPSLKR